MSTGCNLRPDQFNNERQEDNPGKCPFCPGREDETPAPELHRINNESGWDIRVVPNKFKVLGIEGKNRSHVNAAWSMTIADAHGAHEMVIETPQHDDDYSRFPVDRFERIFQTIAVRVTDLRKDPDIGFVQVYKNFGFDAGATLRHEHMQIIGLPDIPEKLIERFRSTEDYFRNHKKSIFEILLDRSKNEGRIIDENKSFVSLVPYEAKFPYEIWILPVNGTGTFAESSDDYRLLAQIVSRSFCRLAVVFQKSYGGLPPFNVVIEEAPRNYLRNSVSFYSWRYKIIPRVTRIAGFELATACYINPCFPEDCARDLRNAL